MSAVEILLSRPEKPLRPERSRPRPMQVNVKLTKEEHELLLEAAEEYALPPSTLARVLVVRGAEAALKK
jgi:hypothetical protein